MKERLVETAGTKTTRGYFTDIKIRFRQIRSREQGSWELGVGSNDTRQPKPLGS